MILERLTVDLLVRYAQTPAGLTVRDFTEITVKNAAFVVTSEVSSDNDSLRSVPSYNPSVLFIL